MRRAKLTFDNAAAILRSEDRHPQVVVREFAHHYALTVLAASFDSWAGCWTFEIETNASKFPEFPAFIIARPHR